MSRHLAGGNALPVATLKGGKGNKAGKGKDQGKGGKGSKAGKRKDQKGKGHERASSQTPSEKNRNEKQARRLHLKGKCPRSAADCKYKHRFAEVSTEVSVPKVLRASPPCSRSGFRPCGSKSDTVPTDCAQREAESQSQVLAQRFAGG